VTNVMRLKSDEVMYIVDMMFGGCENFVYE